MVEIISYGLNLSKQIRLNITTFTFCLKNPVNSINCFFQCRNVLFFCIFECRIVKHPNPKEVTITISSSPCLFIYLFFLSGFGVLFMGRVSAVFVRAVRALSQTEACADEMNLCHQEVSAYIPSLEGKPLGFILRLE